MAQSSSRVPEKPGKGLLWEQIAAAICDNIAQRKLAPGSQLETELQLAGRHGVSRFTVRHALADLERRGIIRIEHGRGLFVAEDAIPFVLNGHMRYTENLMRLGLSSDRRFLESYRDRIDADLAEILEVAPDSEVVVVRATASINGRRIGLSRDLYPAERFAGIEELLRENPSPTIALKSFGVMDYRRKSTRISSRMPDLSEAEHFGIARTRPLLETTKLDVDVNDRPIAWGISSFPADRVHLVVE